MGLHIILRRLIISIYRDMTPYFYNGSRLVCWSKLDNNLKAYKRTIHMTITLRYFELILVLTKNYFTHGKSQYNITVPKENIRLI